MLSCVDVGRGFVFIDQPDAGLCGTCSCSWQCSAVNTASLRGRNTVKEDGVGFVGNSFVL